MYLPVVDEIYLLVVNFGPMQLREKKSQGIVKDDTIRRKGFERSRRIHTEVKHIVTSKVPKSKC